MTDSNIYSIRTVQPDDYNFILATWLKGLYYGDSWFSQIPKDIFMNHYKKVILSLLTNPAMKVQIAALKEDPNVILGYSVVTKNDKAIVWCFVKTAFRRQGIARSLLPTHPECVTLLTSLGKSLLPKLPTAVFNPFHGA